MKNLIFISLLLSIIYLPCHCNNLATARDQSGTWVFDQALTQNILDSYEGASLAFPENGSFLAAGAPGFNGTGEVQIYTRSGNTWSRQITLSQNVQKSNEGGSVSLSADGNTLAAGAKDFKGTGATQIYVRQLGTLWTIQDTVSQGLAGSNEGFSVALSGDGNTLAVGTYK